MYKRQIETVLKLNPDTKHSFRGVFAMDELPDAMQYGSYIINLSDSSSEGSHWCSLIKESNVEYMDPFGLPPLDKRCIDFLGYPFYYSSKKLQSDLSIACGFYCVYFIVKRAQGMPFSTVIDILSRVDSEYIVKDFLYTNYRFIF